MNAESVRAVAKLADLTILPSLGDKSFDFAVRNRVVVQPLLRRVSALIELIQGLYMQMRQRWPFYSCGLQVSLTKISTESLVVCVLLVKCSSITC